MGRSWGGGGVGREERKVEKGRREMGREEEGGGTNAFPSGDARRRLVR